MGSWCWRFEGTDGSAVTPRNLEPPTFPSQADAETWIGEAWRELLDAGVDQVRLWHDDQEVYGPMSLRPLH